MFGRKWALSDAHLDYVFEDMYVIFTSEVELAWTTQLETSKKKKLGTSKV